MSAGGAPRVSPQVYRRRRAVVLMALLLLVVVPVLLFAWPGWLTDGSNGAEVSAASSNAASAADEPEPKPSEPTIEPAERADELTALQGAVPTEVLRFALVDEANETSYDATGPLEMWSLTYSDGESAGADRVDVVVGQWDTASAASEGFDAVDAAAVGTPETGVVEVDDEPVGTWTLRTDDTGRGTVVWRNGTVVVSATGPAADIEDFYAAYPF